MAQTMDGEPSHLRVSAHVLVQLGGELVTDVEQAILECVKNAYDADSNGCRVEIDTRAEGSLVEKGAYERLGPHSTPTETVTVRYFDSNDQPVAAGSGIAPQAVVSRELRYIGRITIIDSGAGIPPDRIGNAWLMISGSLKRNSASGPKEKTDGGRTPLGDKGLGRLGTMKLGDILMVESAVGPDEPVSVAHFRWKDCDTATAVDEVPVNSYVRQNKERLKGTRVSILGLNDLPDWRRSGRIDQIARSLAKLVSPFEATTTFPVSISLDGQEHSLLAVTNQILSQAVAEFSFRWVKDDKGNPVLRSSARFKKGLFGEGRSDNAREKFEIAFGSDTGDGFIQSLDKFSRTKTYKKTRQDGPWLIEFQREQSWTDLLLKEGQSMIDPGEFEGAFYFFHLDTVTDDAAAGLAVNRKLIKEMSGISILRDGFQVRSRSDWLDLAAGMTTGSTYHMRVNNTIGYFALTGERNYLLTEKSDREGFVEDAAYRGFYAISNACKKFANESLEAIRRAFDAYVKDRAAPKKEGRAMSSDASVAEVTSALSAVESFKTTAGSTVEDLSTQLSRIESTNGQANSAEMHRALTIAKRAAQEMAHLHAAVKTSSAVDAFAALRQERDDHHEQMLAMVESAAVGLSARGLAHELRTHLGEIRHRLTQIVKVVDTQNDAGREVQRHVQSIRTSCSAIMSAASLIDPMLPRSRALKDTFSVYDFLADYTKNRTHIFEREAIAIHLSGESVAIEVRTNKARMLQVLDNLVSNSIYWLGRAEVTGELSGTKSISIEATPSGYSVSDSGPGVDPHYETSLFDLFVSGKPERDGGQGLGLFISRQLLAIDGCEIHLGFERNSRGRLFRFDVNLSAVKRG